MSRITGLLTRACAAAILVGCQGKPLVNRPLIGNTEGQYAWDNRSGGEHIPSDDPNELNPALFPPRTVRDPATRDKWELSLEEAKRIAITNNKQIAFLKYQPAQAGTQIANALAQFDTRFEIGNAWGFTDRQISNTVNTFGTTATDVIQNLSGGNIGFGSLATGGGPTQNGFGGGGGGNLLGFTKRNATGGLTSVGYSLDYVRTNPAGIFTAVNPSWTSELRVGIEQPLAQGAGVQFNRAPLLIANANQKQSASNFITSVQTLMRDVELRYWDLYFAYQDYYSRETGLTQALSTWMKVQNEEIFGSKAGPDVAEAKEQLDFFRSNRLQALARVLNAERQLREVLGAAPEDGRQIVLRDEPITAEFEPSWGNGVQDAMVSRPDLQAQRFAIRAAELELYRQKNGLLPDVTLSASYTLSGLDNQFDQSIDRLTDNLHADWVIGLRMGLPLGERAAHAAVRNAQLQLSLERAKLQNAEHTVLHDMHEAYQSLVANYELISTQRDRRQSSAQQVEAQFEFYKQGKTTIDRVLDAQRRFADALRDEQQSIVGYNQSLANWEFAKGTILRNDNIVIAEQLLAVGNQKMYRNRETQIENSIVVPIHPGGKIHEDPRYQPDPLPPLYPQVLDNAPERYMKPLSLPKNLEGANGATSKPTNMIPSSLPTADRSATLGSISQQDSSASPVKLSRAMLPAADSSSDIPKPRNFGKPDEPSRSNFKALTPNRSDD